MGNFTESRQSIQYDTPFWYIPQVSRPKNYKPRCLVFWFAQFSWGPKRRKTFWQQYTHRKSRKISLAHSAAKWKWSYWNMSLLRGNGTPPLCDVRSFEVNNENYFLLISLFVLYLITFRVAYSFESVGSVFNFCNVFTFYLLCVIL